MPTRADVEEAIAKNMDESKKKKFMGVGGDGLTKISNIEHRVLKKIPHTKGKISAMAWGPAKGDVRMALCDQEGLCFVWDTYKVIRLYGVTDSFAQTVALSPEMGDNAAMLVGGMRNSTSLYVKEPGTAKMKKKKEWIKHDGYISSLHFLTPQKYISSSGDADIRVFDMNANPTGDNLMTLRGHYKDAQSLKFPRDDDSKNIFITCSSDKSVKLWDLRVGACCKTFVTDSELNSCCIFPNGQLIGCGGEKDKTYVFDVRACAQVGKYARNNQKTASCEFSASGRELFVGHDDGAIIVWDIFGSGDNKQYVKKIDAHTQKLENGKPDVINSRVQSLDVGPDGFLASAGFDGSVKIWGSPEQA